MCIRDRYNTYSICSMKNITDYTLYDVKIRFVLDPEVYCDKVRLLLNESGAMPSAASVEYQTKNGVKKTEQLNVDKNELTVNADDPITCLLYTSSADDHPYSPGYLRTDRMLP